VRPEDARTLAAIQEQSYAGAGAGLRESYPPARAMNAEGLAAFLGTRRYAVLATTRPDGRPHAAPIAFTVWEGAFWIASVEGVRTRSLRARSYAVLVVTEGEGPSHRAVIVEGRVRLLEGGADSMPDGLRALWIIRHGSEPTWAAVFIELRPDRLFSFDASKESSGLGLHL